MAVTVGTLMAKAGLDIDTSSFAKYESLLSKVGSVKEIFTKAGLKIDDNSFSDYTSELRQIDTRDEVFTEAGLSIDSSSFSEYTSSLERIDNEEKVSTQAGLEIDLSSFSEYTSDLDRIDSSSEVSTLAGLEIDQSSFSEYTSELDRIDNTENVSTSAGLEVEHSTFSEYNSKVNQADDHKPVKTDAGLNVDHASFNEYATELDNLQTKFNDFSSAGQLLTSGAFASIPVVLGEIASSGLEVATGFEDASTTLTTLYGDLDTAKEKFMWLADFAASTPFEFPELMDATIKLKAYGIEAQNYMGVIGDTASAMGKSLDDTVEAVADAQTGEFERMKEFGIKAVQVVKGNLDQFAQYGASVGDTMLTYVDKNGKQMAAAVDRNNREMITSTITAIWNEKYAGAMETRSKTLTGLSSTLKDNLSMALADFVGFDLQTMEVQTGSILGIIKELTSASVDLTSGLSDIPESVQAVIAVATLGAAGLGLMAAGFIAYNAILPLATAETGIFGVTLSAAIWPATAVVGAIALLAGGLVYLDEKTGVVSAAWQFLADTWTMGIEGFRQAAEFVGSLWDELANELSTSYIGSGIVSLFTDLADALGIAGGAVGSFLDAWHGVAESIRGNSGDTQTSISETGTAIEGVGTTTQDVATTTQSSTGVMAGAWDTLKTVVTGNNQEMATSAKTAASDSESAWSKAVKDMQESYDNLRVATDVEGLETNNQKLIDTLSKGVQGNGEIMGLNNNQELVIEQFDGTIQKLNELDAAQIHVFNGIDQNYAIIVDDGSKNMDMLDEQAANYREMGYEILVVKQNSDDLNGASLSNASGQISDLKSRYEDANGSVSLLNGQIAITDGKTLTGIDGQVINVDTSVKTTTGDTGTLNNSLNTTNLIPMSTLLGQTQSVDSQINTNTSDTNTGITTFGTMNNSPFGVLFGNLSTAGLNIDTNTSKTGDLNGALENTNNAPFGVLFVNLGTANTKTGDVKSVVDDTNNSLNTFGGFTFGTTLSSLGSVYSTLGDIYERAKNTVSELFKVGTSSSKSNKSASSGSSSTTNNTTNNTTVYVSGTTHSASSIVSTILSKRSVGK